MTFSHAILTVFGIGIIAMTLLWLAVWYWVSEPPQRNVEEDE